MKSLLKTVFILFLFIVTCAGCSQVAPNEVFSADDLNDKIIGVQLGTTGDIFASDIEGAKIERYKIGADAFQALKEGIVDAVIIDDEPAKVFVSKIEGLSILDEEFAVEEYAVAVKKGNIELTENINAALTELEADGTLASITSNWIGENAGQHPYVTPEGTTYPNGILVMATNAQFPPYEYLDENGQVIGFDADMMKAVCDRLGYELVIENIDFDSIIAAVDSGKADVGVAGMTVTEDRLKNIDFTNPYTTATQVIVVRSE